MRMCLFLETPQGFRRGVLKGTPHVRDFSMFPVLEEVYHLRHMDLAGFLSVRDRPGFSVAVWTVLPP